MKINLKDGGSNLIKLIAEFGIASFIIFIYIMIFICSQKISIENNFELDLLEGTEVYYSERYGWTLRRTK